MTETLWETDAHEFGRWVTGWRARLLVARSVEKNANNGRPPKSKPETSELSEVSKKKIGAETFARKAAEEGHPVCGDTVLAALRYWEDAYADGAPIPFTADLVPGQEVDLAPVEAWDAAREKEKPAAEKEEDPPFIQGCHLIDASDVKLGAVLELVGLSATDAHDLRKPLNDLEDTLTQVRGFIDTLECD